MKREALTSFTSLFSFFLLLFLRGVKGSRHLLGHAEP